MVRYLVSYPRLALCQKNPLPTQIPPTYRHPCSLFLASTVSALHRNAHIWNASHPLLVTYYCRVTVYSLGMEAKKLILEMCVSFPRF